MKTNIFTWPKLHQGKLLLTLLAATGLTIAASFIGELKTWQQLDSFDIVGEFAASLMALFWLWLLMISRPRGKVTNLLLIGTSLYWLTTWLDLLDEFIRYPNTRIFAWLESLPVPIGMVLISIGLVHWLAEQQHINRQLAQREHFQREHSLIDAVTQLYNARYFMLQLTRELELHQLQQKPLSVAIVDIDHFADFNRQYGMLAGDNCLRNLAGMIELGLRQQDLACRLANDRFVMLLPDTDTDAAQNIVARLLKQELLKQEQLSTSAEVSVTTAVLEWDEQETAADLMARLSLHLDWHKRCRYAADQGVA
ncbi:GGDEF domain-containing protein [Shewanella avicenniae]|uniref:diguanylate cyclase n=1 Tax=Shewanella avicenniae TaxID=2814294 RepID=A0ABX7QS04_9GAMM|nr:GGDEF domain-containing protein [Shewanella avicenniae]QSX34244.1 GGDEF domain-containing protein [Shewanella avicenniae]